MRRAQSILEKGFELAPVGRAGKGAYFWQYYGDPTLANELAIGWYKDQVRRKVYDEEDPTCAVIDASFEVDEEDAIDCTGDIQERVAIMLRKLANRTENDISDAYDSIISKIEEKRGKPFLLARAYVSPPKISFPDRQIVPYPSILVVRDLSVKMELKIVETEE